MNGGFYGEVTESGGQVTPQPRAKPQRPATSPLRGAEITDFKRKGDQFSLEYTIGRKVYSVTYDLSDGSRIKFKYFDSSGNEDTDYDPTEEKKNKDKKKKRR